jgi:hypothetical protein
LERLDSATGPSKATRPVRRRYRLVVSLALTCLVAALSTSYAIGGSKPPGLRSNLPAGGLQATQLLGDSRIAAANAIGDQSATDMGITDDSYSQVRVLSTTTLGSLLLIPGSDGACLVLGANSSCGDPGAPGQRILALLVGDSTNSYVGGGVAEHGVSRVSMTHASGKKKSETVPVLRGVFGVSDADGVSAERVVFDAQ